MVSTPRERVLRALDVLLPYLHGFVNQAFEASSCRGRRVASDIGPLVHAVKDEWRGVFAARLDSPVRNFLHELLEIRNGLSHGTAFDDEEARRACDTIRLVAKAIGAPLAEYDRSVASEAGGPPPKVESRPTAARHARGDGRTPAIAPQLRSQTRRRPSQRDVMREIWGRCAPDEERAIREYAAAEQRGDAPREQNTYGRTAEQYARALLADGLKKGWLRAGRR